MTKREVINAMLATEVIAQNEDFSSYLTHELELLDNKAKSRAKAQTKANEAMEALKEAVFAEIGTEGETVTEILARIDIAEISTSQKLTAVLTKLVDTGKVKKVKEGKKSFYSIA